MGNIEANKTALNLVERRAVITMTRPRARARARARTRANARAKGKGKERPRARARTMPAPNTVLIASCAGPLPKDALLACAQLWRSPVGQMLRRGAVNAAMGRMVALNVCGCW